MWRLQDSHTEALVVQPESGMGYQIVRATVNSRTQLVFVFNAELCLELSELADVPSISFEEILDDAKFVNSFSAQQILAVEQVQELWLSGGAGGLPTAPTPIRPATAAGGALAPSPLIIRTSRPHEGFVRLSASPSDYRIMSNGEVRKGTYATTVADARFAVTGLAAAGRYALPNPSPATYAYTIVPRVGVSYVAGTVRPAYAQSGGGVEVRFDAGAPAGSAFRPYLIPDQ